MTPEAFKQWLGALPPEERIQVAEGMWQHIEGRKPGWEQLDALMANVNIHDFEDVEPTGGDLGDFMQFMFSLGPNALSWARQGSEHTFDQERTYATELVEAGLPWPVAGTIGTALDFLEPGPEALKAAKGAGAMLGMLPFLRSVRRQPEALARLTERAANPGGARGMMEDMERVLGARGFDPDEPGTLMLQVGDPGAQQPFVRVTMRELPDGSVELDNLLSTYGEAGRGEMRQLMPVLDVADANGVTLVATPQPYNHARYDLEGLYRMYAGAGFEPDPDMPTRMIRRPMPFDDAERKAEAAARMARTEEFLERTAGGLSDPGLTDAADQFLRGQLGITLEDWLYGIERMGEDWGREMLEQTSLQPEFVEQLMASVRLRRAEANTPDFTASARAAAERLGLPDPFPDTPPLRPPTVPLTELGIPQIPTSSSLASVAAEQGPDGVRQWLMALEVSPEAAERVAEAMEAALRATPEGADAAQQAVRQHLQAAYAEFMDPDSVRHLMSFYDDLQLQPVLNLARGPDPRLYPEREMAGLGRADLDELERVRQSVASGDDTWLGRAADDPDLTGRIPPPDFTVPDEAATPFGPGRIGAPGALPGRLAPGVDSWHSTMMNARARGDEYFNEMLQHFQRARSSVSGGFKGQARVDELIDLPGARGEHLRLADGGNEHDRQVMAELIESMRTEGYHQDKPILIYVEADGRAHIGEGNHRIRAAQAAGLENVPIDVRYFGGAEGRPGVWMPQALRDYLGSQ